jgi:hypothetical protein
MDASSLMRWAFVVLLLAGCATTQPPAPEVAPRVAAPAPPPPAAAETETDGVKEREQAIVMLRAFIEKYPDDVRFRPDAARRLIQLVTDTGDAARLTETVEWLHARGLHE